MLTVCSHITLFGFGGEDPHATNVQPAVDMFVYIAAGEKENVALRD